MFGIGFGEFVIIALVLIVAVGPEKLPALMKTVGRTLRQVKQTSEDLRRSTGIDDLMRENLWEEPKPTRPPRPLPQAPPEGTRAADAAANDEEPASPSGTTDTQAAPRERADAALQPTVGSDTRVASSQSGSSPSRAPTQPSERAVGSEEPSASEATDAADADAGRKEGPR